MKHPTTFALAFWSSFIGSVLLLIGALLWTEMIKKVAHFGTALANTEVDLTVDATVGHGLRLCWAAFACLVVSIVPYTLRSVLITVWVTCTDQRLYSCLTYRRL